jgi:hypothetical protein
MYAQVAGGELRSQDCTNNYSEGCTTTRNSSQSQGANQSPLVERPANVKKKKGYSHMGGTALSSLKDQIGWQNAWLARKTGQKLLLPLLAVVWALEEGRASH